MSNRRSSAGDLLLHYFTLNLFERRQQLNNLSYRLDRRKPDTFNFKEAMEKAALRKLYRELLTDPNREIQLDMDEEREHGWAVE